MEKKIKYRDYVSDYTFKEKHGPRFKENTIRFGSVRSKKDVNESQNDTFITKDKNDKHGSDKSLKADGTYKNVKPIYGNRTRETNINRNPDVHTSRRDYYLISGNFLTDNQAGLTGSAPKTAGASIKYKAIKKTIDATKEAAKKAAKEFKKSNEQNDTEYFRPDNKQYKDHKVLSRVEKASSDVMNAAKSSVSVHLAVITLVSFLLTLIVITITTAIESTKIVSTSAYPESVLQWQSFVVERCAANNDPDSDVDLTRFSAAILATIWQESGGRSEGCGGDLMQCRASGLWNESERPAGWSIEQYSIDVGIRYFYMGLKDWGVTDPSDFSGLQIVAQGYNYSWHYLSFMRNKALSSWTLESSAEYAASRGGHYGHVTYGSEWLEKYQTGMMAGDAVGSVEFLRMKSCADQYLGYPYVWGGKTPGTSFDCSGFVCWAINNSGNGWNIGYKDANGLKEYCMCIDKSQAQPGDLVFFHSTYGSYGPDYATHVGIYMGNGTIIHSSSSMGVAYKDIENSSYHQQHFLCYGRLPFMAMKVDE